MISQLTSPTALIAGVSLVWTMGTTAVSTAQKLTELDTRLDAIDHRLDKIADSLDGVASAQLRRLDADGTINRTTPHGEKRSRAGG